jgi:hypothetical protein
VYLDEASVRAHVGDFFVDAATIGSGLYRIPFLLQLKGVWYPVRELGAAICFDQDSPQAANVVRVRLCNEVRARRRQLALRRLRPHAGRDRLVRHLR